MGNLGTTTKMCNFVPKTHPGSVAVVATPSQDKKTKVGVIVILILLGTK